MKRIRLATTTSTENSGLLRILLPAFEKRHGVRVDVTAAGSGRALDLARRGEVDAVLTHAREAEERFIDEGHGLRRVPVMANDFVIVGPPEDPAGIRGPDASKALAKIASSESAFASRGDDSGTHVKEKELWVAAGLAPGGDWHVETGRDMGATLLLADGKRAYCLIDRGTWLAMKDRVDLRILCEGDPALRNPYSIIAVNPDLHPDVNRVGASLLIEWLTSQEGQGIIGGCRIGGELLFHPAAHSAEENRRRRE